MVQLDLPTNWTSDSCVGSLLEGGDDAHEVAGLEGGAADEAAVDVGLGEQFGGVAGLAAAAVEDGGVVGHLCAVLVGEQAADEGVDFLCLVARGGLAGTDGPDGLIGDDDVGHLLGGQVEQGVADFGTDNLLERTVLALLEALAAAEDHLQAVLQGQVNLGLEHLIGLVVVATALAVTQDHVVGARRGNHSGRNLTSVGTAGVVGAVLSGQAYVSVADDLLDGHQVSGG